MKYLSGWILPLLAVGLLSGIYGYHRVLIHKADAAGYARAEREMAAQVAKQRAEAAANDEADRAKSRQAAAAWEAQRNDYQKRIDTLLRAGVTVRLCKPASTSAPAVPSTKGNPTRFAGAPDGEIDSLSAGRNIGTELVQLGAECERYQKQINALLDRLE